jgi:very-short-patch-repair endonuclease
MGALLDRSGTGPWVRNHPVRDASNRMIAEIDFAHLGLRIAIEVDGRAHHTGRTAFERDRERQNILMLQGWLVLRFTWEQITQRPHEVLAAARAAVAQRVA